MRNLEKLLLEFMPRENVLINEPMASHTSFRLGGPADLMAFPRNADEAVRIVHAATQREIPILILGKGSNMIVRDGGLRALVVKTALINETAVQGDILTAGAGVSLAKASAVAMEAGLSGLEFACGIPGSVGGASAMNAGAYGFDLSGVLLEARVLLDGQDLWLSREQMSYGYRSSVPLKKGGTVLESRFRLKPDDPKAIRDRMDHYNACRREKQPLSMPSAGSVFKRPEGHYAGALIERAGLKGYAIGGAQVSPMHAGFIVNNGDATAKDVTDLIRHIQAEVLRCFGVALECEVRILGEED